MSICDTADALLTLEPATANLLHLQQNPIAGNYNMSLGGLAGSPLGIKLRVGDVQPHSSVTL